MSDLIVRTEPLGGSALVSAAIAGQAAHWYERRPTDAAAWKTRVEAIRAGTKDMSWLDAMRAAFEATGRAAARLDRVGSGRGVVVTTGQQPGLFGGPVYTWSKALSALALADEIESATGVPAAPIFWAATDDADFAEASWTAVAVPGGAERLFVPPGADIGRPMAEMPLSDPTDALETFVRSCGATVDSSVIDAVRDSYAAGTTVGGAYVQLLRRLFEPLGIAVLDAAHPAVSSGARPLLVRALDRAAHVAEALRQRGAEITHAGYAAQVAEVEGLSLVFERTGAGSDKRRIPVAEASAAIAAGRGVLSPNVLLRPVIERALFPTVSYVAGPGEISYFAQVSAVADALGVERPLVVPRWSTTVLEPHVRRILDSLGIDEHELADPHRAEGRLATASVPPMVTRALADLRLGVDRQTGALATASGEAGLALPPEVFEGARRSLQHRVERLERRIIASVKRREHDTMLKIATARGALFPFGTRQERALNLLPMVARHGGVVIDRMLDAARAHARGLVGGAPLGPRAADDTASPRSTLGALPLGPGSAEGSRVADV